MRARPRRETVARKALLQRGYPHTGRCTDALVTDTGGRRVDELMHLILCLVAERATESRLSCHRLYRPAPLPGGQNFTKIATRLSTPPRANLRRRRKPAMAGCYSTSALPIGQWVDRMDRYLRVAGLA